MLKSGSGVYFSPNLLLEVFEPFHTGLRYTEYGQVRFFRFSVGSRYRDLVLTHSCRLG
jgi:hypothetical protein